MPSVLASQQTTPYQSPHHRDEFYDHSCPPRISHLHGSCICCYGGIANRDAPLGRHCALQRNDFDEESSAVFPPFSETTAVPRRCGCPAAAAASHHLLLRRDTSGDDTFEVRPNVIVGVVAREEALVALSSPPRRDQKSAISAHNFSAHNHLPVKTSDGSKKRRKTVTGRWGWRQRNCAAASSCIVGWRSGGVGHVHRQTHRTGGSGGSGGSGGGVDRTSSFAASSAHATSTTSSSSSSSSPSTRRAIHSSAASTAAARDQDYRDTRGVSRSASAGEINQTHILARRRLNALAKKHPPADNNYTGDPSAGVPFRRVRETHEELNGNLHHQSRGTNGHGRKRGGAREAREKRRAATAKDTWSDWMWLWYWDYITRLVVGIVEMLLNLLWLLSGMARKQ